MEFIGTTAGSRVKTLAAGALQTSNGNNATAAEAILTAAAKTACVVTRA